LATITGRSRWHDPHHFVVADSDAAQKALVFFSDVLTDGIELSDDPLPARETSAYALSFVRRQQSSR